jgi:copper chaperone CopZ
MKKWNYINIYLCIFFFAVSCTDHSSKHNAEVVNINKNVKPNFMANIEVSGMVCEVNCVSAVNQALMSLEGVASVEIDFDSEKDTNNVQVKFDNTLVTADKLKETIESLNNHQYKVEKYQEKAMEDNTEVKQDKEVQADLPDKKKEKTFEIRENFTMPNLFNVIISYL